MNKASSSLGMSKSNAMGLLCLGLNSDSHLAFSEICRSLTSSRCFMHTASLKTNASVQNEISVMESGANNPSP